MRSPKLRSTSSPLQVEADLNQLEVGIRQLKVQYDMFFAGGLKTQPLELRRRVEKIIRHYAREPVGRYCDRFRYNGLVARFNSFAERWGKAVRSMEEGDHRNQGTAERLGIREHLLTRCVVQDSKEDDENLRRLHTRYVEASREHGKRGVSYQNFLRGVASQTRKLREQPGCGQIELRLVVRNDRVQLKARPGR